MKTPYLAPAILLLMAAPLWADVVYQTNFDSLTLGQTQPNPGDPGQDNWYSELAAPPAYGEIQNVIANTAQALHEYTDIANTNAQQTIDIRPITPPNLALNPLMTLSVDFYARSSDYDAVNTYWAAITITGGPHPGFEVLALGLFGGNGTSKNLTGVNVGVSTFNNVMNNNEGVPLTVGQNLSWETWHSLTLIANQALDRYVSLTVDGQTQILSNVQLPRFLDDQMQFARGQLMENINALIIPNDWVDGMSLVQSNDDVFWDNLALSASVPEPSAATLIGFGSFLLSTQRRRRS